MGDQTNQSPASAEAPPAESLESNGPAAPGASAATSDSAADGVPGAIATESNAAPNESVGNGQTPAHPVHGVLDELHLLMGKVIHFENLGILHHFEGEAKALIERIRSHFG